MRRAVTVCALGLLSGCSTLADTGGGTEGLPNAGAGPFREIRTEELGQGRTAPNTLRDDEDFPRDATVVEVGDGAAVHAYVARTALEGGAAPDPSAPPTEIARFEALDGRSFGRTSVVVLTPELDWEGGTVGAPSALRVGGQLWLYYAAAGGIGRATSDDGAAFTREPAPVLGPEPGGWEQGATPRSPAVIALPDGSYRMFYEAAGAIGEASLTNGLRWTRLGDAPVLAPTGDRIGEVAYESVALGGPAAVLTTSATGRQVLWLYYGAEGDEGRRTVGAAARLGLHGPFERAVSPVFGTSGSLGPREPWVVRYPGYTLLFATQRAGTGNGQDYPAVAVGVAPADAVLPTPDPP